MSFSHQLIIKIVIRERLRLGYFTLTRGQPPWRCQKVWNREKCRDFWYNTPPSREVSQSSPRLAVNEISKVILRSCKPSADKLAAKSEDLPTPACHPPVVLTLYLFLKHKAWGLSPLPLGLWHLTCIWVCLQNFLPSICHFREQDAGGRCDTFYIFCYPICL